MLHCGDDVYALERFSKAQVTAFRKILKKYKVRTHAPTRVRLRRPLAPHAARVMHLHICMHRTGANHPPAAIANDAWQKWTGSTSLNARFNEEVLSSFKSFTKRDFAPLRQRHSEILTNLRDAAPAISEPSSPSSVEMPPSPASTADRVTRVNFDPLPPASMAAPEVQQPQPKYWNEYDDGSEAGDFDDYAIYINPEDNSGFPGMGYVNAIVSMPYEKIRGWFKLKDQRERRPLLGENYPTYGGYSSAAHTDSDEEAGYSSSDGIPTEGYVTHYAALPSINEQQVRQYRERVLFWGTLASFASAYILMGVAAILISTGKRKLRVEVDVGVTVGVMMSLFCSCAGLGMTLYRRDTLSIVMRLLVWFGFTASCLINGMLLILVVGNAP